VFYVGVKAEDHKEFSVRDRTIVHQTIPRMVPECPITKSSFPNWQKCVPVPLTLLTLTP
jgi:hypothetical protein